MEEFDKNAPKTSFSSQEICYLCRETDKIENMLLTNLPFIFGLGGQEVLIVLVVVLLLFGAKKIPELARGLGKGIREFKDASREIKREIETQAKAIDVEDSGKVD
ncbi:MAG: twin-arginine translocase TatA/TatE family subunit [Bacteroidota bacterium]